MPNYPNVGKNPFESLEENEGDRYAIIFKHLLNLICKVRPLLSALLSYIPLLFPVFEAKI